MDFKQLGVSASLFYYIAGVNGSVFDISLDYTLAAKLDRKALSRAIKNTLECFPEFAIRPAIHDGIIGYLPNTNDVPLIEKDEKEIFYGTDETAGYPFVFLCREDGFRFCYFHGLTDARGATAFIHTLFYNYAKAISADVPVVEKVRTKEEIKSMDEMERWDPYVKFARSISCKPDEPDVPGAFMIPEKAQLGEENKLHYYEFSLPLGDFLKTVKSYKTSVGSFIAVCLMRALKTLYDTHDIPIKVSLSADLRTYYETETVSNFSDSIILTYNDEMDMKSKEEQFILMRQQLKGQMSRDHFDHLIVNKIETVRKLRQTKPWESKVFSRPEPRGEQKLAFISCPISYSGKQDLPEEYAFMVKNVVKMICVYGLGDTGVSCTTYGNAFRFSIQQTYETDRIIEAIRREFSDCGITPGDINYFKYMGYQFRCDKLI